jgi:hypothetical protein
MHNDEIPVLDSFLNLFKKKRVIKKGDIGIYKEVLTISTINDGTHTLYYDIYTKVKAIAVYDNLVEIEVLDVMTLNSCNQDITNLINSNMPKYIKPKYIKWELEQKETETVSQ